MIAENWELAIAAILIAAKIANKLTKHWPEWSPYLRWLGFLVEVIDVIQIRKPKIKPEPKAKGPLDTSEDRALEVGTGNQPQP